MISPKLKKEHEELCALIKHHNRLYFQLSQPHISDEAYDLLYMRLLEIENTYSKELDLSHSPTQSFQSQYSEAKTLQIKHSLPMLSLQKAKNAQEWLNFCSKHLPLVMEPKLDGVSVSIHYQSGQFHYALTRGNGVYGMIISEKVRYMEGFVETIEHKQSVILRGEICMSRINWQHIQHTQGNPTTHPRNIISGWIMSNEIKKEFLSLLNIVIYDGYFLNNKDYKPLNSIDILTLIKNWGVKVIDYKIGQTLEEIQQYHQLAIDNRDKSEFFEDGTVYKVSDISSRELLGSTATHSRWSLAYKYPSYLHKTTLLDIVWQVSRYHILTPVGLIEPITLEDKIVRRVSLHNYNYVLQNKIQVGSQLFIILSGGIIPSIQDVVNVSSTPSTMEVICASCKNKAMINNDQLLCSDNHCPGALIQKLTYITSRECLNIQSLGRKSIGQMVNLGIVSTCSHLFTLTHVDLSKLEGFKQTKIDKTLRALSKARKISLEQFLLILSIHGLGKTTVKTIAPYLKSVPIKEWQHLSQKNLMQLDNIGLTTAKNVAQYFTLNHQEWKDILNNVQIIS